MGGGLKSAVPDWGGGEEHPMSNPASLQELCRGRHSMSNFQGGESGVALSGCAGTWAEERRPPNFEMGKRREGECEAGNGALVAELFAGAGGLVAGVGLVGAAEVLAAAGGEEGDGEEGGGEEGA